MSKDIVKAITLAEQGAAVFNSTYQIIGTGLSHPCFYIRLMNATNKNITVSYDGTTDNDVVLANSTLNLPVQMNSQPNNYRALFSKGLKIYIKGEAGGAGSVYLSGYYQD